MMTENEIQKWVKEFPLLETIMAAEEVFWRNPKYHAFAQAIRTIPLQTRERESPLLEGWDESEPFSEY